MTKLTRRQFLIAGAATAGAALLGEGIYLRRDGDEYEAIEHSNDVAVVEKKIIEEQVVILVHGFGEEQTRRAARHLINSWERLYKQHGTQEFGIRV